MLSIAEKIKAAREGMRLSQRQLAEMVEAHPQTIVKLEGGTIEFSRYFGIIERALKMPAGTLTGEQVYIDGFAGKRPVQVRGGADLPVYQSQLVRGGVMVATRDPTGFTLRPPSLINVKDAYSLKLSAATMSPAFEPGDEALVHPFMPPEIGKEVLLRGKPNGSELGPQMVLGLLHGFTAFHWIVIEHNGGKRRKHSYSRKDYPVCHRVVGRYIR